MVLGICCFHFQWTGEAKSGGNVAHVRVKEIVDGDAVHSDPPHLTHNVHLIVKFLLADVNHLNVVFVVEVTAAPADVVLQTLPIQPPRHSYYLVSISYLVSELMLSLRLG